MNHSIGNIPTQSDGDSTPTTPTSGDGDGGASGAITTSINVRGHALETLNATKIKEIAERIDEGMNGHRGQSSEADRGHDGGDKVDGDIKMRPCTVNGNSKCNKNGTRTVRPKMRYQYPLQIEEPMPEPDDDDDEDCNGHGTEYKLVSRDTYTPASPTRPRSNYSYSTSPKPPMAPRGRPVAIQTD